MADAASSGLIELSPSSSLPTLTVRLHQVFEGRCFLHPLHTCGPIHLPPRFHLRSRSIPATQLPFPSRSAVLGLVVRRSSHPYHFRVPMLRSGEFLPVRHRRSFLATPSIACSFERHMRLHFLAYRPPLCPFLISKSVINFCKPTQPPIRNQPLKTSSL